MSYTPSETKILIDYHRKHARTWKDCQGCGITFQGDGDECSDCSEAARLAALECERETLRDELRRHWQKMSYTALLLWKRRIEEINEIFKPQTNSKCH